MVVELVNLVDASRETMVPGELSNHAGAPDVIRRRHKSVSSSIGSELLRPPSARKVPTSIQKPIPNPPSFALTERSTEMGPDPGCF